MERTSRAGALVLLLSLMLASVDAAAGEQNPTPSTSCVVLLHGLGRTALSMKALQWRLEDAGYGVVNITYPSLSHPIEELSRMAVNEGLAGCEALGLDQVSFVTHSLGGILVRQYLAQHDIPGLQRVVMLGPPNQGSQMADYLESLGLLEPFLPSAVVQLGLSEQSVPRRLGPVNFQLGVIAGTVNQLPFLPGQPDELGDGTVAVSETLVSGMADFLELPVGHTLMMWDKAVAEQVVFFLEHGVFNRHAPPLHAP
ncbi:MAG: esterase/lipase family protein [Halioglobus sp.]